MSMRKKIKVAELPSVLNKTALGERLHFLCEKAAGSFPSLLYYTQEAVEKAVACGGQGTKMDSMNYIMNFRTTKNCIAYQH